MIPASAIRDARILIVDELDADIQRLETILGNAGYTFVMSTREPQSAIKLQKEHRFNLILLGLVDACGEIAHDGDLPVLAMTADPDERFRALKGGARDFVGKPFDKLEVLARVHNTIEANLMRARLRDYGIPVALFDNLTGLPNRVLFLAALQNAIAENAVYRHKVALLFLDLDWFKNVNVVLGHNVGDECLQQVARRLGQRNPARYVLGRLGGDEFAFIVPLQDDEASISKLVEQVFAALKEPFYLQGHEVNLDTSIGVAVYPDDAENAESLMASVDKALYRAKKAGRNTVRFSG